MFRNANSTRCIAAARLIFLALISLSFANQVFGQQQNNCRFDKASGKTICTIPENDPRPLGPVSVPNSQGVIVRVTNKSPFDECTMGDIKLTDIKESDPIVTILQLFTQAATGAKVPSAAPTSVSVGNVSLGEKLYRATRDLRTDVENEIASSKTRIKDELKPLVERIDGLVSDPPRSNGEFPAKVGDLITRLAAYKDQEALSMAYQQARYVSLQEQVKQLNDPLAADIIVQLNYVAPLLEQLKDNYDGINASYVLFKQIHAILKGADTAIHNGKDPFAKDLPLLPYKQQSASTSVTCSSTLSKKPTTPQIPVVLNYQSNPRLSVSVGPLISMTAKRKLGTTPVATGPGTFKSVFAVVDHARVQVIPFAFLNYRIAEFGGNDYSLGRKYSLNFSAGIGVNSNNGSNEVEYFLGPSFGFKKIIVEVGDHIGRFQKGFTGGFNLGDTVPASFPSTVPIEKEYKHGFSFAVTYKLPL